MLCSYIPRALHAGAVLKQVTLAEENFLNGFIVPAVMILRKAIDDNIMSFQLPAILNIQ